MRHLTKYSLACGTGKLTGALLGHPEWKSSIVEIKGIDPNDDMRAVFAKAVKDTRASVSAGTFDDTGVPDNWADLITVASVGSFSSVAFFIVIKSQHPLTRHSIGACISKQR